MIADSVLGLFLSGWLIAAFLMIILWISYLFHGEPAVVDVGWSLSIGSVTCWIFYQAPSGGLRQWVLLFFVLVWSLRLTLLLLNRMRLGLKDRRYRKLSQLWSRGVKWKYLIFFQLQAFSVAVLTVPLALSMLSIEANWTFWDSLGVLIFAVGIVGEGVADRQMASFRSDPANHKKVCERGLWYYSRHPNYFFEWIIWVSYAVIATNHPLGFIGWGAPALILLSLLKVTGIPATENQLLASRGELYREYQRTTSVFIPMPKRKS